MTFGEKLKNARLSLNISQSELAQRTGISERSLYAYEQKGAIPRASNLQRLADALGVSAAYLLSENEPHAEYDEDRAIFLNEVKSEYGSRGEKEAAEVLERTSALFAGGELDDAAKEVFFRSVMEMYLESKAMAREKFSTAKKPQRASRKKRDKE